MVPPEADLQQGRRRTDEEGLSPRREDAKTKNYEETKSMNHGPRRTRERYEKRLKYYWTRLRAYLLGGSAALVVEF